MVANSSGSKSHHRQQRTSPGSYGTILPSSFSRVLQALWSTRPDHLCRFLVRFLCNWSLGRLFPWKHGISYFTVQVHSLHISVLSIEYPWICLRYMLTTFHLGQTNARLTLTFSVPIALHRSIGPQPLSHRLRLGPALGLDSTQPRLTLDWNPCLFSERFFTCFVVPLRQHSQSLIPPAYFSIHLHRLTERSPHHLILMS